MDQDNYITWYYYKGVIYYHNSNMIGLTWNKSKKKKTIFAIGFGT